MRIDHLWLTDFRSYQDAEFAPAPDGITVISGGNGEGKTNLVEAIAYLATLKSFRASPNEAMVRSGGSRSVVRAEGHRDSRRLLIEAELQMAGRDRVQVNGQPLRRTRDLLGYLQVTVFSPDDLALVKSGPQLRRDFLDDLLVALHPRHDETITEVERVLKQRNALLKSAGLERVPGEVASTLDVWDRKLAEAGEKLAAAREGLITALEPVARASYGQLATRVAHRGRAAVGLSYERSWRGGLLESLAGARNDDLRRGITTVGPHRDEVVMRIGGLPARSHASQGEQRSFTLALRLAGHAIVTER
ncbi:MAG TPA: DNA replication and repair protein RecF, partial [Acidimicrobiales bacterium]|nr:DNA replication and repair protein RecF [Acidimicrobiales bacterium]